MGMAVPNDVGPEGPIDAKIVVVGEAPGEEEVRQGRPFVGTAGKILTDALDRVGVSREACYITNLVKVQPNPSASGVGRNEFGALYQDKQRKAPTPQLLDAITALEVELQALIRPHVIIALGNEPLRWLTGRLGISNWRGSVLQTSWGVKVVPTYHPAAVGRQWDWYPLLMADLRKVVDEAKSPALTQLPTRIRHLTQVSEVGGALLSMRQAQVPVAFDIETAAQQVQCIAFANGPTDAVVIPLWVPGKGSLWSMEDEVSVWAEIRELFATTPTVGHNVHYDLTYLKLYDVYAKQLHMDTMAAFHVLYLELPKALDVLTSLYTDIPYYKWMAHPRDGQLAFVTPPPWNEAMFWDYNGLDALATWRCMVELGKELHET